MADNAFSLLLQHIKRNLNNNSGTQLLIADENLRDTPLVSLPNNITLLTNRFDLNEQAQASGIPVTFNDFDFSVFEPNSFDQILYRVSKEKSVVHHIINQTHQYLKSDGKLILIGKKNEGIKTFSKTAAHYFCCAAQNIKHQSLYSTILSKTSSEPNTPLDDKNYAELREEIFLKTEKKEINFYSKPGVFGWNKIDQGSAFLTENLNDFLSRFSQPLASILDLGCGYGYLSAMAHQQLPNAQITATDNNAAAIAACKKNFREHAIDGMVLADDCAKNIEEQFDAVLCNPPFHQGFGIEGDLTNRFVEASHSHLKPRGKALFVVNSFLPLERKACEYFSRISLLAENRSFKLLVLEK